MRGRDERPRPQHSFPYGSLWRIPGPTAPQIPPQATWGAGTICGYVELTETLIISHKPVIEKARKRPHQWKSPLEMNSDHPERHLILWSSTNFSAQYYQSQIV